MSTPHKHAELIKAWADGAEIERRVSVNNGFGFWEDDSSPTWHPDLRYRLKPHKWQHCIDAQKAGKVVQARLLSNDGRWVETSGVWDFNNPYWEFRIKPETIRYRVALCCGGAGVRYPEIVGTEQQAAALAGGHGFIDWLTDWVEVEV
jgi:hypothetical protein